MQNPQLVGVGRADYFNLKGSMCVIALFGIITIISYFNELNKAGLLRRGVVPGPLPDSHGNKRYERAVNHHTLIERDGDIHNLGLHILKIKQNTKHKKQKGHQEINIKLHLGQNASYVTGSNSTVPMYNHKNTLLNFYSTLNVSQYNLSALNLTSEQPWANISVKAKLEKLTHKYQKSILVFSYQHEPQLHKLTECLRNISLEKGLAVNNVPVNRRNRKQWDAMSRAKRNAFNVLYGGSAFGVCESVSKPCGYITFISHPVDRLVALYELCRPPVAAGARYICRLNNADIRNLTLTQFALAQGSSLFENLVDYAKHCRLIGDDELCVQGSRTTFVLTPSEADAHLRHILAHLDTWFASIGLTNRLHESLDLLKSIYELPFSSCIGKWGLGKESSISAGLRESRTELLANPEVKRALHADLQIYKKFSDIFKEQLAKRKIIQGLIKESKTVRQVRRKLARRGKLKAIKASKLKGDIFNEKHKNSHKNGTSIKSLNAKHKNVHKDALPGKSHNQTLQGKPQGKHNHIQTAVKLHREKMNATRLHGDAFLGHLGKEGREKHGKEKRMKP